LIMKKKVVGVKGFEPSASSSRTKHANQTALHPEKGGIISEQS
jgi:hypothetical protein